MDNLISRQAAIALADSLKDKLHDDERVADCVMAHNEGILEYQTALSLLPSSDAVEVVRCKDCRYGYRFFDAIHGTTDSWIECRNPDGLNRDVSEDSFCSYGGEKMADFKYWCGNCQIKVYIKRHYGQILTWEDCPFTCEYATAIRRSTGCGNEDDHFYSRGEQKGGERDE